MVNIAVVFNMIVTLYLPFIKRYLSYTDGRGVL